jgi:hypothetical protein
MLISDGTLSQICGRKFVRKFLSEMEFHKIDSRCVLEGILHEASQDTANKMHYFFGDYFALKHNK